jgi:subtilisin
LNTARLPRLVMLSFIALLALAAFPAAVSPAEAAAVDRYIVVLRPGVDAQAVAQEHAAQHAVEVSHVYSHALRGYAARLPAARLARIEADSRVLFVAPDGPVQLLAQTLPTGVNRIEGDQSSTRSWNGSGAVGGVNVAIIDTGIQSTHPDLNVVGGTNCSNEGSETNFEDGHGHGTHVAGIIGAKDDGNGVVGMAPGVPLYAVKVFGSAGNSDWSWVICGIDWVTGTRSDTNPANDIHVANMSLGDVGSDDGDCGKTNADAVHLAICGSVDKGVTYVVAAGNNAKDLSTFIPAAYDKVITVTSVTDYDGIPGGKKRSGCLFLDRDDTAADLSNYATVGGPDAGHTIAAPGSCIYSTHKGSGYTTKSGTSMASPHVAGVAALCLSRPTTSGGCAGMSPGQVMEKLRTDAAARSASYGFRDDPNSPNGSRYYGYLVYAGGY